MSVGECWRWEAAGEGKWGRGRGRSKTRNKLKRAQQEEWYGDPGIISQIGKWSQHHLNGPHTYNGYSSMKILNMHHQSKQVLPPSSNLPKHQPPYFNPHRIAPSVAKSVAIAMNRSVVQPHPPHSNTRPTPAKVIQDMLLSPALYPVP